jgi:hypothetical protein
VSVLRRAAIVLLLVAGVGTLGGGCILGPKQDDPSPEGAGADQDSGFVIPEDVGVTSPDAPKYEDTGTGGADTSSADAGPTTDAGSDSGVIDAAGDVAADAPSDAPSDTMGDAPPDADALDGASDGSGEGGADVSGTDAATDSDDAPEGG